MRLAITHETHYRYSSDVEQAHHVAMLYPLSTPTQDLMWARVDIYPQPDTQSESLDALQQRRLYFDFSQPHSELKVVAHSEVITRALPSNQQGKLDRVAIPVSLAWTEVADYMRYNANQSFDGAREFVQSSPLALVAPVFARYVEDLATPSTSVFRLASELCQR
ncbi:MAG: hypothetical protein EAZ24_06665, partial [Burkholderiales bacterium]